MKHYIEIIKNLTAIIEKQQDKIDRYKHMLEPENVAVIDTNEGTEPTKTLNLAGRPTIKIQTKPRKKPKLDLLYTPGKKFSALFYSDLWNHFQQLNTDVIEKEDNRVELEDYIKLHLEDVDVKSLSFIDLVKKAFYTRLNELIRLKDNYIDNIPCQDFPPDFNLNCWEANEGLLKEISP